MKTYIFNIGLALLLMMSITACGTEKTTKYVNHVGSTTWPIPPNSSARDNEGNNSSTTDNTSAKRGEPSEDELELKSFPITGRDIEVNAPEGTLVQEISAPDWSTQSIASAIFLRPSGAEYRMLVYEKQPGESFEQWSGRSEVGNNFQSLRTVRTQNGHTGYVYDTNDMGLIPEIHITVPTERFVYYFAWDTGLPTDPLEAAEVMRELNDTLREVPADFLRFVQEIELP